jgi:hypothetical protein
MARPNFIWEKCKKPSTIDSPENLRFRCTKTGGSTQVFCDNKDAFEEFRVKAKPLAKVRRRQRGRVSAPWPGNRTTFARGRINPTASSMRNAPTIGEPSRNATAANAPAAPTTAIALSLASPRRTRIAGRVAPRPCEGPHRLGEVIRQDLPQPRRPLGSTATHARRRPWNAVRSSFRC